MARSGMPDSAGSQFFIMHENAPHLDGEYAAFGKVIEGMEVVNHIAETATDRWDRPKNIYYGADSIPKKWVNTVLKRQDIEELCNKNLL